MSDIYWERHTAGVYYSQWFARGYKYKITGEGTDWTYYYMWHKDTKKVWKYLGRTDRLKDAKIRCERHNNRPRTKYKFKGRVEGGINDGKYRYVRMDYVRNRQTGEYEWQESRYSFYTLDPRTLTMSEAEIEADDERKELERRKKEIDDLNRMMTMKSPLHEKGA